MFGLSTYTIHALWEVFRRYPEVERAILYGSRAKGGYRVGSDIDLTLEGAELNLTILQKIEWDIEELLLPYKIDLSLLENIRSLELLDQIKQTGKVFYSK